ncbi:unnamed protein product [Dimorphilus gyrociliatus]|uniref:C2H2-type domain-containing protein n=1 Tax=Dimorphilus gyrociliatus TaxID=2664684 RepID=A0A7I8VAW7_9ANNE|nr:unnamed protein product [Dimorphilus gyrociliatus]
MTFKFKFSEKYRDMGPSPKIVLLSGEDNIKFFQKHDGNVKQNFKLIRKANDDKSTDNSSLFKRKLPSYKSIVSSNLENSEINDEEKKNSTCKNLKATIKSPPLSKELVRIVYECNLCHYIANSKIMYSSHSHVKHNSKSKFNSYHQCRVEGCNILCDSKLSIRNHLKSSHNINLAAENLFDYLLNEKMESMFVPIVSSPKKLKAEEGKKDSFSNCLIYVNNDDSGDDDSIEGYCSEVEGIVKNITDRSEKPCEESIPPLSPGDYTPRLVLDLSPSFDNPSNDPSDDKC